MDVMRISGFVIATSVFIAVTLLIGGSAVALTVIPVDVKGRVQDIKPIGTAIPAPSSAAQSHTPAATSAPVATASPVSPPEAVSVGNDPTVESGNGNKGVGQGNGGGNGTSNEGSGSANGNGNGNSGVGQGNGGGNGTTNEGNGKGPTK
ncbi:MAG: hypothetical protein V4479_08945 [Actinomycetota bacterium]